MDGEIAEDGAFLLYMLKTVAMVVWMVDGSYYLKAFLDLLRTERSDVLDRLFDILGV